MSLTAQEVLLQARRDLRDEDSNNYRWPNTNLINYLNEAQYDLRRRRVEYWLDSNCSIQDIVNADEGNLSNNLLIDDKLKSHISSFVVFKALSEDDADTENLNRAISFRAQYEQIMR